MTRERDLDELYGLLADLRKRVGGYRTLGESTGRMDWPKRGVYFFFSPDETRADDQLRVTRVGTHAVSAGSKTTLWERLRAHRGTLSGAHPSGGNHRGSVFRLRVGEALICGERVESDYPTWGNGSSASSTVRDVEYELEKRVSEYIRELPLLWVEIDDEAGSESQRARLERNTIALLSNYRHDPLNPRDATWLGADSPNREIRESGLWNVNHVGENHSPDFLDEFWGYVEQM